MPEGKAFQIVVSGYISEVICGTIPDSFKEAFTNYLIKNRDESLIPAWLLKGSPHYVSSDQIQQMWYLEEKIMGELMGSCGHRWRTYRDVDNLCRLLGFGSGKEGIGIFEIGIVQDGQTILEFVPFEPTPDSPGHLRNMDGLSIRNLDPPPLPCLNDGYVAVSAGTWAKGILSFALPSADEFCADRLELLVIDLTDLGVGEDHFVAGLSYGGKELTGELVKKVAEEMYQVSWHSPQKGRWLHMHERG